jgi:hypothetical protein
MLGVLVWGVFGRPLPATAQQWSPLGSGMNSGVYTLTVFDDGSGPALYAGVYFTTAGGVAANHIARWQ